MFGDLLTSATKALEEAKEAAKVKAAAQTDMLQNIGSNLEAVMAATPGQLVQDSATVTQVSQLVASARESTAIQQLTKAFAVETDGISTDAFANLGDVTEPDSQHDAHHNEKLSIAVAEFLSSTGEAVAPGCDAGSLASLLLAHGAASSKRSEQLEANVKGLEEQLTQEVSRVSGLLAECESLRAASTAAVSKEVHATLANTEAAHREELERLRLQAEAHREQNRREYEQQLSEIRAKLAAAVQAGEAARDELKAMQKAECEARLGAEEAQLALDAERANIELERASSTEQAAAHAAAAKRAQEAAHEAQEAFRQQEMRAWQQVSEAEAARAAADERVAAHQAAAEAANTQCTTLEERYEAKVATLVASNGELQSAFDVVKQELNAMTTKCQAKQIEHEAAIADTAQATQTEKGLRTEMAAHVAELERRDAEILRLGAAVRQAAEQEATAQAAAEAATARSVKAERAAADAEQRAAGLAVELRSMREELDAGVAMAHTAANEARQELADTQQQARRLQLQLEKMEEAATAERSRTEQLERSLADARCEGDSASREEAERRDQEMDALRQAVQAAHNEVREAQLALDAERANIELERASSTEQAAAHAAAAKRAQEAAHEAQEAFRQQEMRAWQQVSEAEAARAAADERMAAHQAAAESAEAAKEEARASLLRAERRAVAAEDAVEVMAKENEKENAARVREASAAATAAADVAAAIERARVEERQRMAAESAAAELQRQLSEAQAALQMADERHASQSTAHSAALVASAEEAQAREERLIEQVREAEAEASAARAHATALENAARQQEDNGSTAMEAALAAATEARHELVGAQQQVKRLHLQLEQKEEAAAAEYSRTEQLQRTLTESEATVQRHEARRAEEAQEWAVRLSTCETALEDANRMKRTKEAELAKARTEQVAEAAEAMRRQEAMKADALQLKRQLADVQEQLATQEALGQADREAQQQRDLDTAAAATSKLRLRAETAETSAAVANARLEEAQKVREELERELAARTAQVSHVQGQMAVLEGQLAARAEAGRAMEQVRPAASSTSGRRAEEQAEAQLAALRDLKRVVEASTGGGGGNAAQESLRTQLSEARLEADALSRRLTETQNRADTEQQQAAEYASQLRQASEEAVAVRMRFEERIEESERLSTQRAAAAAAERREVATLRGLLDAAQEKHERRVVELMRELEELRAQSAPIALSAKQLPSLMDALEACQQERRLAMAGLGRCARADAMALAASLRDVEEAEVREREAAAAAIASADEQRKAAVAELRKEAAQSKKKATALLLQREKEAERLQALLRQQQMREPTSETERTARAVAAAQQQAVALRADVARLERERNEWQLRNLELHQMLRTVSLSERGSESRMLTGNEQAAEAILAVAKQQAQRDEELMEARMQVVELQAQIVEARELHNALRERCADTERQLKRTEHGSGIENTEYLKNIIFKMLVMEGGQEKLLPVVATFLQFSPDEVAKVQEARVTSGTSSSGTGLLGKLGEDWLFGASYAPSRKIQPARATEESEGGAWKELEVSWKKIQRLKQLLSASQAHLQQYQAQQDALMRDIEMLRARGSGSGGDGSGGGGGGGGVDGAGVDGDSSCRCDGADNRGGHGSNGATGEGTPALMPRISRGWADDEKGDSKVLSASDACASVVPASAIASPQATAPDSSPAASHKPSISSKAGAPMPVARSTTIELSDAEQEAELALQQELKADEDARQVLEAAMRSRDPPTLRRAIDAMAERGLDCDDESIDAARLLLGELTQGGVAWQQIK